MNGIEVDGWIYGKRKKEIHRGHSNTHTKIQTTNIDDNHSLEIRKTIQRRR